MRVRLTRRRLVQGLVAGAACLVMRPAFAQVGEEPRAAIAGAASAFFAALPDDRRRRAVFAFGDAQRLDWHYVPRRREGLALKDMPPPARKAAHGLMQASLSVVGYAKVAGVIVLEEVLRQQETFGAFLRDPDNYALSVFGTPGASAPWGWRIEGHHLSLNFTVVPDRPIAATPAFLGANPAEVRTGPHRGRRTLAREEELGRALARSADAGQQARMLIGDRSLGDIVSGPGRSDLLSAPPAGLALADMSSDQRGLVMQLVEEYVRNMRSELAEAELARLRAAGPERLHFAWAGSLEPGKAHYYRLHGPTLLVEYDNTQNDANHIHSVWHDPRNDFGQDLLRAHYDARGHRHA